MKTTNLTHWELPYILTDAITALFLLYFLASYVVGALFPARTTAMQVNTESGDTMKCKQCGKTAAQTLSDNCASRIGRYKTVAYYCETCDKIFILDKYKDKIDAHKYDEEYTWLRAQSCVLHILTP